ASGTNAPATASESSEHAAEADVATVETENEGQAEPIPNRDGAPAPAVPPRDLTPEEQVDRAKRALVWVEAFGVGNQRLRSRHGFVVGDGEVIAQVDALISASSAKVILHN